MRGRGQLRKALLQRVNSKIVTIGESRWTWERGLGKEGYTALRAISTIFALTHKSEDDPGITMDQGTKAIQPYHDPNLHMNSKIVTTGASRLEFWIRIKTLGWLGLIRMIRIIGKSDTKRAFGRDIFSFALVLLPRSVSRRQRNCSEKFLFQLTCSFPPYTIFPNISIGLIDFRSCFGASCLMAVSSAEGIQKCRTRWCWSLRRRR